MRLAQHMLGMLLLPARHTVTNLICAREGQNRDWTADYRLYSKDRADPPKLFDAALGSILEALPEEAPLVVGLDDTLVRKTGAKIHGVGWRRDPLGPPFQTNLVRGQRWLQFSAAWPLGGGAARMVPINFVHAPTFAKLPRNAGETEKAEYREALKQQNLNRAALEHIGKLLGKLEPSRKLILVGDGSFTNQHLVRGLPEDCIYIGRARKDMALHYPVGQPPAPTGRPRRYGERAPTPEGLRKDPSVPWIEIEAFAAGKRHVFRIKTLGPLLWRKAGAEKPIRLVVIAPVKYRKTKNSKPLYREPAYLICTDPNLPLADILQYYLWRWGIEENFRDEKTLLGLGEAQVRNETSNRTLPATVAAAYSLLWCAALKAHRRGEGYFVCPVPKWRKKHRAQRKMPSTGDLLRTLRFELLGAAMRPSSFSGFLPLSPPGAKPEKLGASLAGILFSAA